MGGPTSQPDKNPAKTHVFTDSCSEPYFYVDWDRLSDSVMARFGFPREHTLEADSGRSRDSLISKTQGHSWLQPWANQHKVTVINLNSNDGLLQSNGLLAGQFGLRSSGNSKVMSVRTADDYLNKREAANHSQDDGKDSYPDRSIGGSPSRPISGAFFFLFGFAVMKLAFYVGDESEPPRLIKLCCFGIGIL